MSIYRINRYHILIMLSVLCMSAFSCTSCGGNYKPDIISETKEYTINYNQDMDDGEVAVLWGPELFEDMNIDNMQLALVSASLLAASGEDGSKEHSNDYYITEAYKKLGFDEDRITLFNYPKSDESSVDHRSISDDITFNKFKSFLRREMKGNLENEHCFAIGDVLMPINGEMTNIIVITMRGTESREEGIGDYIAQADRDFYGKHVYNYFEDYSDKVFNGLAYYINKHPDLKNKPAKVLIGGHSLGGAAANLVGARFDYCIEDQGGNWKDLPWGKGGPTKKEDIAVFTFGALNVFGNDEDDDTKGSKFDNICNIFNYYDTFGPNGDGYEGIEVEVEVLGRIKRIKIAEGTKPAGGAYTFTRKFGVMMPFINDYRFEFEKGMERYMNHNMPGYIKAVQNGIERDNATILQVACSAYKNKMGFPKYGTISSAPRTVKITSEEMTIKDRADGIADYVSNQSYRMVRDRRIHSDVEEGVSDYNDVDVKHLSYIEKRIYGDELDGTEDLVLSGEGSYKRIKNRCYFSIPGGVPNLSFGNGWDVDEIKNEDGNLVFYAGVWSFYNQNLSDGKIGNARITMKRADVDGYKRYVIDSVEVDIFDDTGTEKTQNHSYDNISKYVEGGLNKEPIESILREALFDRDSVTKEDLSGGELRVRLLSVSPAEKVRDQDLVGIRGNHLDDFMMPLDEANKYVSFFSDFRYETNMPAHDYNYVVEATDEKYAYFAGTWGNGGFTGIKTLDITDFKVDGDKAYIYFNMKRYLWDVPDDYVSTDEYGPGAGDYVEKITADLDMIATMVKTQNGKYRLDHIEPVQQ